MKNRNPKDGQITNDDNAVTNIPPDPLKGEEADNIDDTSNKADDDESEEESSSNKDAGPAGENL